MNRILKLIYSPFFEIISKQKFFKYILINIPLHTITKYNLKNDYISVFENFNKSNIDYNSLNVYFTNDNDFSYLKDFKIKFNIIKKLYLFQVENASNINDNFCKIFSSFFNIDNNLISLHLEMRHSNIKTDLFENINNFKSLKDLYE